MRYYRYGHAKDVFVKTGETVKKGQKIGTIGDGNGQWSSHLHFDISKKNLQTWTNYVFGMTKNAVRNLYEDPAKHRIFVYPDFDHFGWQYLEKANYSGKYCYHPGEDLNGRGAGHSDKGTPFYSATDGTVVYCYAGPNKNAGWGKLIVIQESKESPKNTPTTNETEEGVPIPIFTQEEAEKLKITQTYDIGEKPTTLGTGNTSEPPIETVFVGAGVARTEESSKPVDPNVWEYTAKPRVPVEGLHPQSKLEKFVNWFLDRWDKYRDVLLKK